MTGQPNPLLARIEGEPVLVAPEMGARVEACLAAVAASEHAAAMLGHFAAADDGFWPEPGSWQATVRPYVVRDGVLQIPVKGVLLNDFPFAFGSFATGYAYIRRAFDRGLADGDVRGIALVCDTPGGMVAGNFDLVDAIFAARGRKPVRAFAHEGAYSAGYGIASAADRIVVSRSGGVGSVGVVTMHRDVSGALQQAGVRITLIFAGEHKTDGTPFAPLPPAVRDRFQARVEQTYAEFVGIVARNRGLAPGAVRDTKALTYGARDAIAAGLADAVGSLDDAVAEFAAALLPPDTDEDTMSIAPSAADPAPAPAPTTSVPSVPAASGPASAEALAAARTEATASGEAAGRDAERARTKAILGSEHAKGRDKLANHLAFETDFTVAQAEALLRNAEKAAAPSGSRLDAAMSDLRVDPNPPAAPKGPDADTAALAAAVDKMVTGLKPQG